MNQNPKRAYLDTSVFGGYFDPEFKVATQEFFEHVLKGSFRILLSEHNLDELEQAPEQIQDLLLSVPAESLEVLAYDERVPILRDAYLKAGVVTQKCWADAEHIAWASVAMADFIVSWNFKHIVHVDRISGYHAVNIRLGYPLLRIHTPKEVIPYDP